MASRSYFNNFTPHQQEALIGADVTYERAGNRCGWTGHIESISGNKVKIHWDQQHSFTDYGCTTYCSGALLHPFEKYIRLSNEALLMSYQNTVTTSHFYMVINQEGSQRTGKITHDEAVDKATQLAQDSQVKEIFYVVRSDEKFYATKPPITREAL